MRQHLVVWVSLMAVFAMAGCSIHAGANPPYVRGEGIVSGHAALTGIRPWDGRLVDLKIIPEGFAGDWASLEIWPLGEIGIGLAGARLKLIVPDVGLGVLLYKPKPARWDLISGEVKDASELENDSEASRLDDEHMQDK